MTFHPCKKFYVEEEFMPIIEEFDQICYREGTTRSEKLREFIMRYVMVHSQGNPQLILDKFCGEIRKHECFFCHNQKEQLWKVEYISGLVAPTCPDCLNREKAKASFSTIKKVRGVLRT